jgi:hypothetical protein
MKQAKQPTAAPQTFEVIPQTPETVRQMFFDGVTSIDFGAANCKLHFYQIVDRNKDTNVEQRQVVLTGVMSTAALAELCLSTLKNINANIPRLKHAIVEHEQRVFAGETLFTDKK